MTHHHGENERIAIVIAIALLVFWLIYGVIGCIAIALLLLLIWHLVKQSSGASSSNGNCQFRRTKDIEVPKISEVLLTNTANNNDPGDRMARIASTSTDTAPCLYTLQYFGSDRNQLQKARAGCIIKNSRGEFCIAAAYNLDSRYPDCHVAIAEAFALWNGLKLAKRKNVRLGSFQGRNDEIRDRVLNKKKSPPKSSDLTEFIEKIQNYFSVQGIDVESTMELVGHEEIGVARALAIEGQLLTQTDIMVYESVQDLPQSAADLLN